MKYTTFCIGIILVGFGGQMAANSLLLGLILVSIGAFLTITNRNY